MGWIVLAVTALYLVGVRALTFQWATAFATYGLLAIVVLHLWYWGQYRRTHRSKEAR